MRFQVVVLVGLGACVPPSMGPGPSTGTSYGSSAGLGGVVSIPDVLGMSQAQAMEALHRAGVAGDISVDSNGLCGSVENGKVIELGTVCSQAPSAGSSQTAHSPVSFRVQTEDPWHGNNGKVTEWRLMPQLVGLSVDAAKATMIKVGFTRDDQVMMVWVDDAGCKPLTVCRTNPDALERAGLASTKNIFVGRDPNAAPPAPTNTNDPTPPTPQSPEHAKDPEPFF